MLLAACGAGGDSSPLAGATESGGNGTTTNSNNTGINPAGTPQPGSAAQEGAASPSASGSSSTGASSSGTPATADATKARFSLPLGIAVDGSGNLYVADTQNYTVRKIAPSGMVTTLAGTPGASGSTDGTGAAARFSFLKGIAVDGSGNVYAVDNSAIRKITPAGVVTTLAGASGVTGDADGLGAAARFRQPWGIAADADGTLYVADTDNYLVRKISPAGVVTTHAGTRGMRGTANGSTATATFLGPKGIARDSAGNLYLTDWYGPPAPNIPEGNTFVRRIGADGSVTTMAGNFRSENGPAAFSDTFAIAADAAGNVYLAALRSVQKVSATGAVSTVAGPGEQFQVLNGIASDNAGNLFVTDESAHTVSRVGQDGSMTLVAGKPGESGSADVP